jgi:hypothetical protein
MHPIPSYLVATSVSDLSSSPTLLTNNYQPISNLLSAMSFHLTAEDVHIVDNHMLCGHLRDEHDLLHESLIDLDQILGNENGLFKPLLAFTVSTNILTAVPQAISIGAA